MFDRPDILPVYDGGTAAEGFYNAGPMLADDREGPTPEDTRMRLITDTTAEEFAAYRVKLAAEGFSAVFENATPAAECVQWVKDDVSLYGVFNRLSGEVRLFLDGAGVTADRFGYAANTGRKTEIYQYGLYYDPANGHSPTTTNCGMLYIVKLCDNSLFLIDGGHILQCSVKAVTGLYRFLHRITGIPEGETVPIACWFITHAHDDHLGALLYILENAPDVLKIDRIFWDLPPVEWLRGVDSGSADYTSRFMKAVEKAGIPVTRLQKGDVLDVGLRVEILHDARNYMRCSDEYSINDTSVCMRVSFPWRDVLFLGDIGPTAGDELLAECPGKLPCGVVQMAHHGQRGAKRSFYEAVGPEICLWTAPDWLWENDSGGGRGSGPWKTLETRGWMDDLGVKQNYACAAGDYLFC